MTFLPPKVLGLPGCTKLLHLPATLALMCFPKAHVSNVYFIGHSATGRCGPFGGGAGLQEVRSLGHALKGDFQNPTLALSLFAGQLPRRWTET